MKNHNEAESANLKKLRQQAEQLIKESPLTNPGSEVEIHKLIHELQVHKIELQIQNEELLMAVERAEIAEKKYTELYELAPSGYITLSKEGDIVELNYSAARLLNKGRSKLINNRFALFLSEKSRRSFIDFFKRVFERQQKETCEAELEITDSSPVYINIDGIISRDKELCLLTIMDITRNKQADESMFQLKLAQEAIVFKQNFLANVSHEMRTPLTGILGMIDILEQTHLSPTQMDYIETLKHSGENLREIINQVLDYSKIEAGKVKLKPTLFASKGLLAETERLYKGAIKKEVELITKVDPKIPEYIHADERRIRQVINNLVSNALKFTTKGVVELTSQLLWSNLDTGQVIIKISVTDTGLGIPEEKRNKLFKPFSQIDDTVTRTYEGTGLGLSICKELAMLLGGEIGVESEYLKGSKFWFTFPAQMKPTTTQNEIAGNNHDHSKGEKKIKTNHSLNILFAEDKVVNQKIISLILLSMGHVVTIANDGQQALNMYEPGKFDLILMDIQMPVMDGITATHKLKEKYKRLPPIVGLSANAFEGDRDKYMGMGLDDYVTKPINKEQFKELINKLLN